jgi:hypothetical protein
MLKNQPPQIAPALKQGWYPKLVAITRADLFWIMLVSGLVRIVYYSALLTTQAVDTATYVNYRGNLLNGVVDPRRTPVYPYFIKLVSLFGPAQVMDNVVIVQCILSLLSIVVFYKTLQLILKSRSVIIAATLFYGLLLPVINFDKIVINESLGGFYSGAYLFADKLPAPPSTDANPADYLNGVTMHYAAAGLYLPVATDNTVLAVEVANG